MSEGNMVRNVKRSMLVLAIIISSVFCALCFNNNISNSSKLHIGETNEEQLQLVNKDVLADADSTMSVSLETDFDKGEVTGGGRYAVGDTAVLSAVAKSGCYFVEWQIKDGDDYIFASKESNYSIIVNGNATYKAVFDYTKYTITSQIEDYFKFDSFDYSYDSERFNDSMLTNYARAYDGSVYYNDVVTINFKEDDYGCVKQLASNNFSIKMDGKLNSNCAIINIDEDGKILSTQINGQTKNDYADDEDIEYNFDEFIYLILTQKNVGSKSATTGVCVKCKIKGDIELSVNATKVYNLTVRAIDENTSELEYEQVKDLINFSYGYYGKVDDNQYLIENGANYYITFSSNSFWQYTEAIFGKIYTTNSISGYYNSNYDTLTIRFLRVDYGVTFEEYVRDGQTNQKLATTIYTISSKRMMPGDSVVLKYESGVLWLGEDEITKNEVYGYTLFAISNDVNCTTEQYEFNVAIDTTTATSIVVYLIYKKIDYTLNIDVLDVLGNQNQYLASKVTSMTQDKTDLHVGDRIELVATVQTGYRIINWQDNLGNIITTTSFNFTPTSNDDLTINYCLVIDYEFTTLTYSLLDGWDTTKDPIESMSSLSVWIIEYFEVDENSLSVFGTKVLGQDVATGELLSCALNLEKEQTKGTQQTLFYSSVIGDVRIIKNDDEFVSIEYMSHSFLYKEGKFSKDTSVDYDYGFTYEYDAEQKVYKYQATKISCDDVVLCLSENRDDSSYKLNYFTISGSSALAYATLSNNYYAYVHSQFSDLNLKVSYAFRQQKVSVEVKGVGYQLEDVEITINDSTDNITTIGAQKVLSVELGDSVVVAVDSTKVAQGYKFAGFTTNYSVLNPMGTTPPIIADNTMTFNMISEYVELVVTINIEEIDYIINIIDMSEMGLNAEYTVGGQSVDITSGLSINWTTANLTPKITFKSLQGYYISNAYLNEDLADNRLSEIIGNTTEQTNKTLALDFEKHVLLFANDDNVVNLYVNQSARTYIVTIILQISDNLCDVSNLKDVAIVSRDKKLTPKWLDTEYVVQFVDISYGASFNASVMAGEIPAIKFSAWYSNSHVRLSDLDLAVSQIQDNSTFYAVFECMKYNLQVKHGYWDGERFVDIANDGGKITYTSEFYLGQTIDFRVEENPGYRLDLSKSGCGVFNNESVVYTSYGAESLTNNGFAQNGNSFVLSIVNVDDFAKIEAFRTDKSSQLTNDKYRTLIVYLNFEERQYSIYTELKNITSGDKNTTGIELEDWANVSVYFGNSKDGNFVEEVDGLYSVGDFVQVVFSTNFDGILFKGVYFIDDNNYEFKIDFGNTTEYFVANQYMTLKHEDNKYTLVFELNKELLKMVDETINVYLNFEIKKYTIGLSAQSTFGMALTGYNITLIYAYGLGGTQVVYNNIDADGYDNGYYLLKDVLYGTNWKCSVSLGGVKSDFNDTYFFYCFDASGTRFGFHNIKSNQEQLYSVSLSDEYETESDSLSIWQMIGWDNSKIAKITAYFSPKISINEDTYPYNRETMAYTKITTYNSMEQYFGEEDLIYNKSAFSLTPSDGKILITIEHSNTPINVGIYEVAIYVGKELYDAKIQIDIRPAKVSINYTGGLVAKEYDSQLSLSQKELKTIQGMLKLVGVQANDVNYSEFDFSKTTGAYVSKIVGDNIDIELYTICLSEKLKGNYEFDLPISNDTPYIANLLLVGKGKITKKLITFDERLFVFEDIVYKEGVGSTLKYTFNSELTIGDEPMVKDGKLLFTDIIGDDEAYVIYNQDDSCFAIQLMDYSVGSNKKVVVRINGELNGGDGENYQVQDRVYYIDIYPYILKYTDAVGREYRIVDVDEKCLIPMEFDGYANPFVVDYIDSTNPNYPDYYAILENGVDRDEKIHAFYKITVYAKNGTEVDASVFNGCYLDLPNNDDLKAFYTIKGTEYSGIDFASRNDCYRIKIDNKFSPILCAVKDRDYFAIWKIILIVGLCLLFLLIIIIIIIIIKRRKEKESDARHKI